MDGNIKMYTQYKKTLLWEQFKIIWPNIVGYAHILNDALF